MKKLIVLLALSFSFVGITNAQSYLERPTGSELSIGVEGALPLNGWDAYDLGGNHTKISPFGIGLTVKYAYNFSESFAATLQSGYLFFPGNDLGDGKINTSQIPIKAGVRLSMNRFYLEPQAGISSLNVKVKSNDKSLEVSGSTTAFTYAIGAGVMASQNFDIGLRYEAMSNNGTSGYLGLRLAYCFSLKK